MATQDQTTLKSYFETGDVPTESQFADLIDTVFEGPVILTSSGGVKWQLRITDDGQLEAVRI